MSNSLLPPNLYQHTITLSGPKEMTEQFVGHLGLACYITGPKGKEQLMGRIDFPRTNPVLCLEMIGMVERNLLPVAVNALQVLILEKNQSQIVPAPANTPLPPPPGEGNL